VLYVVFPQNMDSDSWQHLPTTIKQYFWISTLLQDMLQ
jgi:hypothetical protein